MRKFVNDIVVQISRIILLSTDKELVRDYNGKDVEIFRECANRIEEARKKMKEEKDGS